MEGRRSNLGRGGVFATGSAVSPLWSPTTSQMPVPARTAPTPAKTHPSVTAWEASVLFEQASTAAALTGMVHTSVTLLGTLFRSWSLEFLSESHRLPSMPAATRNPTPTTTVA